MAAGQLRHILLWVLIGGILQLRNMLGKTVRPSICIVDFISTGTETRNRSSFFAFILSCKYLGARKKKGRDSYLYSGSFV